jgi:hypothetical protein
MQGDEIHFSSGEGSTTESRSSMINRMDQGRPMIKVYTHELNTQVQSISGYYELEREERMEVGGKAILYSVGSGVVDNSCCGQGGCRFAVVSGSIRKFKAYQNEKGLWVSEVEPIMESECRKEIIRRLKDKEQVTQVQFL